MSAKTEFEAIGLWLGSMGLIIGFWVIGPFRGGIAKLRLWDKPCLQLLGFERRENRDHRRVWSALYVGYYGLMLLGIWLLRTGNTDAKGDTPCAS